MDRSHRDGAEEAPDDRCEGVRRENSILGEGVKVAIGNILKPATAYIGDWRSVGGASCLLYFGQPISQPFRAMISLFFFLNSKHPDPDPEDSDRVLDKTRKLGLVVVRGTQVSLVSPEDGLEPIANPFVAQE